MQNIVLLEDQAMVRNVIVETASELSDRIQITCADSVKAARELFEHQYWDGMIADLTLGDGESLELISELRERDVDIPIILASGFLSPEKLQEAGKLGIGHILHKPFHPAALLDCMDKAFLSSGAVSPHPAAPKSSPHEETEEAPHLMHGHLLPDLFAMDRHLGLLFRLLNDIPKHKEVAKICSSSLTLAMDIVRAHSGLLALYDRGKKKLVLATHNGLDTDDLPKNLVNSCGLDATPFEPLLEGREDYIQSVVETGTSYSCWPGLSAHSYIAIPIRLEQRAMGVICLMDYREASLSEQHKNTLGLLVAHLDTLLDNRAVHAALQDSMKETLITLASLLEARDRYTKDHSSRVSQMSVIFATKMGLDQETIELVRMGGLLHDLGKVGIPDSILLKEGRFTDQEFARMKAHPAIGDAVLKNLDGLGRERQVVRHHHERIDGTGYPDQLKGDEIPLEARIVCVADAIDAMTSHRVYRKAQPLSFCVEQLQRASGTQFDSAVVEVAIEAIEEGLIHTQATHQMEKVSI
ncbi:HD-GYP domain, c-di-GMP phosphodiesterase class II (or its inactivated variant) [Mariprofundus ferrinatatus]|uniref:HD-GYP domain, c-di-GMP phosphodiesterase class II (Or its inactivated variant) n=1 Tax=Mariprofundus ferrinatatus TaxID=1921087 RepID=A0A2K8L6H6_9PROT|nr:HD domain-containing phosphohydrolase [Mariprofundus ferrinatatus]ATX82910.1 HD-GYP domain, c-di-GMP phosphodiesterase class II (or its inactivated variant) [Mariprofundus ferrinatatus]